jgi:hypothetical protein
MRERKGERVRESMCVQQDFQHGYFGSLPMLNTESNEDNGNIVLDPYIHSPIHFDDIVLN